VKFVIYSLAIVLASMFIYVAVY